MLLTRCVRIAAAVGLAALIGMIGCSDDSPSGPGPKGSLELRVSYEGSLGTVDAEHVILARLYEGLNSDAQGVPDEFLTATQSPDTLRFEDLPAGTYTLCVIFDVGGDGLQQECPYEVYQDKALGVTPDAVTISDGATTPLAVAFDDTHRKSPGALIPDFALRDINPDSPTLGDTLALLSWRGDCVLIYFGAANCPSCRGQFGGLDLLVRELREEGTTDVSGLMINNPLANGQGYRLDELNAVIPALQDSFTQEYGGYTPAVGALLDCLLGDELLLIDPQGRLHLKVTASPAGYDLRQPGPRETVKFWVRGMAPGKAALP